MDELYVVARRVLLDALEALGEHRGALVLVGAQAVYLHTGRVDLGVVEHTTDADLAIDPALLAEIPPLERALQQAGFLGARGAVGVWTTRRRTASGQDVEVQVDLLVPSQVSPGIGRRAARLPGHDSHAARKVDGLEGALVDFGEHPLGSLEPAVDPRVIPVKVAGPGALLVAKMFKIDERRGSARANDKDALDVLRLLQGVPTQDLAFRLRTILSDERSAAVGARALAAFEPLFGSRGGEGAVMAARAVRQLKDEDEIRRACAFLAGDLLDALK